ASSSQRVISSFSSLTRLSRSRISCCSAVICWCWSNHTRRLCAYDTISAPSTSRTTAARPVRLREPRVRAGGGEAAGRRFGWPPGRAGGRDWVRLDGREPGRAPESRRDGIPKPPAGSALVPREGRATGVRRRVVELLLDPEQLVVLRGAVGPGRGAGLDLA